MEILHLYFILLFGHWIGDFLLQTRWMADNKSHDIKALSLHTLVYSTVLTLTFGIATVSLNIVVPFFLYSLGFFFLTTYVTHWLTDFVSSKGTAICRRNNRWHAFFAVVGFDQLIHQYTIILTMIWLIGASV